MSDADVKALVALRMQQAEEALEDAQTLLSQGRGTRTAVNRAYYAAFYSVRVKESNTDANCRSDLRIGPDRALNRHGPIRRSDLQEAHFDFFTSYSVLALLQTTGKIPRKHSGAITLFDRDFVKSGRLPMECSVLIHALFEARLQDDYQRLEPVTMAEAQKAVDMACQFTAQVHAYLTKTGGILE